MINPISRTREWIDSCRNNLDPELTEKMIYAFILAESLKVAGLDFIFKGGTSLSLITGALNRFSIDLDIIVSPDTELLSVLNQIIDQNVFVRYEEDIRKSHLPITHFKVYFNSALGGEKPILLDVLFDENPYPVVIETLLLSPILDVDSSPISVLCPSVESLLGDKLTAFAPHTTGVLFRTGKELEIIKQLFDIATLFDFIVQNDGNIGLISEAYALIVRKELVYRNMTGKSPIDVLEDTFETCCMIGSTGKYGNKAEFEEILLGSSKLKAFMFSSRHSFQKTVLGAAKASCLAAALIKNKSVVESYLSNPDHFSGLIQNPQYNRLNKVRNYGPEDFFYFCQALEILGKL